MKSSILGLCLLFVLGSHTPQKATTFERTYKLSQQDTYTLDTRVEVDSGGDTGASGTAIMTVKKVYDTGDADVEIALSDLTVKYNGQVVSSEGASPKILRLDKFGAVQKAPAERNAIFNGGAGHFMRLAGLIPPGGLQEGKSQQISVTDDKTKVKIDGSALLNGVSDGIADVSMKLVESEPETPTPFNEDVSLKFDTEKHRLVSMVLVITNLPQSADNPLGHVKSVTVTLNPKS